MFATPLFARRALQGAAKRRCASSSVVSVYASAFKVHHSLRPRAACFSRLQNAAHSESDR